jgi:hypothetical protein
MVGTGMLILFGDGVVAAVLSTVQSRERRLDRHHHRMGDGRDDQCPAASFSSGPSTRP